MSLPTPLHTTGNSGPLHGGDGAGQRHSPLTNIHRANVSQLQPAWTFHSGLQGGWQATPIVVGDTMLVSLPFSHVVALGAATGAKLWNIAVADTTGSGEQMARLAANDPLHQQAETGATGVGIAMAPQLVDDQVTRAGWEGRFAASTPDGDTLNRDLAAGRNTMARHAARPGARAAARCGPRPRSTPNVAGSTSAPATPTRR